MGLITLRSPNLLAAFIVALGMADAAKSAEPFREFLDGLRNLGYYEQALDYLETMRSSRLVDEAQKQTISYEQGLVLIEQAKSVRSSGDRDRNLDLASGKFEEFLKSYPEHEMAYSAHSQLANVLIERARTLIARANSPAAKNKEQLLSEARAHLKNAEATFSTTITKLRAQLAGFKKTPPTDQTQAALRDKMRADLYTAEILAATVIYEAGKTYPSDSVEFKELLTQAAGKFALLYKDHTRRMIGLFAYLYEGNCYQAMGDTAHALKIYTTLLRDLGDANDLRPLKAKVTRSALECWVKEQDWEDAIQQASAFVTNPRGRESSDEDWLAMQYLLAVAYENAAPTQKGEQQRREYSRLARALATSAAKERSDFQDPARELLARMSRGSTGSTEVAPKTFDEALERARTAMDMKELATGKLAAAADEAEQQTLQQDVQVQRELALENLNLALALAGANTPDDQLVQARYYLSYLLYDAGKYWDAAVLGEFVARKSPQHTSAQAAAMIALASYQSLYQSATDNDFEADRIGHIANYIADAWPKTESADKALNILLLIVIKRGELDKVGGYVNRITPDSPRRSEAQITVGQALWSSYLNAMKLPEAERPDAETMASLVQQAQSNLVEGIEALSQGDEVSPTLALATLSLVQIYVDTAQPDKALTLLERERIGPLELIQADNPVTKREGYLAAAYLAAVRAYIGTSPPKFDQAKTMLQALQSSAGDDPQEKQRMTIRLMAMGQSVQQQLEEMRRAGKVAETEAVAKGFGVFLSSIAQEDASFDSLNWVAVSYSGLASGLSEESGSASPEAMDYFSRSLDAYQKALKKAATPDIALAVRIRIADTYRRMRKFDDAINTLGQVLAVRSNLLTAQISAAETLQEQGRIMRDAGALERAIAGDRQRGIWGWGRIATMTSQSPKFRENYHQARLGVAQSRYEIAKLKRGDQSLLQQAKRDIYVTFALFPDLGGDQWSPQYENLLKQIQRDLNQQPQSGLEEFRASVQAIREKAAAAK